MTRAPPLPSSSCTTPTLPENGPFSTFTRAPRSMTTGAAFEGRRREPGRGGGLASRPRPRKTGASRIGSGSASPSPSGSGSRSRPRGRVRAVRPRLRFSSSPLSPVGVATSREPTALRPVGAAARVVIAGVDRVGAEQDEDLGERHDGVRELLVEKGSVLHRELAGHAPPDPHAGLFARALARVLGPALDPVEQGSHVVSAGALRLGDDAIARRAHRELLGQRPEGGRELQGARGVRQPGSRGPGLCRRELETGAHPGRVQSRARGASRPARRRGR